jgi:hypothetical protein
VTCECDMRCDVNWHHGASSRRSRCHTEDCDKQFAATSATGTLAFLVAPPDSRLNHAMVNLWRRGRKIVRKKLWFASPSHHGDCVTGARKSSIKNHQKTNTTINQAYLVRTSEDTVRVSSCNTNLVDCFFWPPARSVVPSSTTRRDDGDFLILCF